MPGHMGSETVTIQNLEVVAVDLENNVILIKGNVPGAKKSLVIIRTSVKHPATKNEASTLKTYEDATKAEEVDTNLDEEDIALVNEETSQESEQQ
jgi:large subunit ribosomal protein L3